MQPTKPLISIDLEAFENGAVWDGLKGYVTNTKLSDEEVILGMDDEQAELYRLVENWVTRDLGNA